MNDKHVDNDEHVDAADDNHNSEGGPLSPMSDEVLDAILHEATWPEPETDSLGRLQSVLDSAIGSSVTSAESYVSKTNGHQRFRRLFPAWIVVASLMTVAFLAGKWFGSRESLLDDNDRSSQVTVNPDEENRGPDSIEDSPPRLPNEPAAVDEPMVTDDSTVPGNPLMAEPHDKENNIRREPLVDEIASGRPIPRREQYQRQLDAVLECLAEQKEVDQGCFQPLLSRRAEFEYLLWEVIRNSAGQQRLTALTAVGFIGSERSVPMLMNTSKDQDLRAVSISSLKRCAGEQTLAAFVLQQQEPAVAHEFAVELAHRRTDAAFRERMHLVQNRDSRMKCLQAANEMNVDLVDRLFAALDAPLVADRLGAAICLGARTDAVTRERLVGLMQDYPTRWEPVAALMWNGSQESMHTLSQLQNDPQRFAVLQTASIQLSAYAGTPVKSH